jgi:hypothetical protein
MFPIKARGGGTDTRLAFCPKICKETSRQSGRLIFFIVLPRVCSSKLNTDCQFKKAVSKLQF